MPPLAVSLPAFASSDYRSNLQIEGHYFSVRHTKHMPHTDLLSQECFCRGIRSFYVFSIKTRQYWRFGGPIKGKNSKRAMLTLLIHLFFFFLFY